MKRYSYILIGDDRGRNHLNKEKSNDGEGITKNDLQLAGLYQWANCFQQDGAGGIIEPLWRRDDLEDHDIVHVNYTPSNLQLPSVIRDELGSSSSTKLVINVDLDVKQWSTNYSYYFTAMVRDLKCADVLFHVEPHGASVLSHLLGRKVHVNPHPVDVTKLYDFIKKEREPVIGVQFHRYTAETLMPYIAAQNIQLRRILFGYTPIGKQAAVANSKMYDQILMYQSYRDHIEELSKCSVGIDLYSGYSYGRASIEMAGLGIPAVVSNTIGAAERLFPFTAVEPFDTRAAEDKLKELVTNPDFADKVIKHAHQNCGYYSLTNSYERFVRMIEEGEEMYGT
jgi:glycosyltransferase involved in cell wall biosynthesis